MPPFKTSLTTSGLFVLLSKTRILFWAGSEYYGDYLGEETSTAEFQNLISEELLTKLVFLYQQSQSLTAHDEDEETKDSIVHLEDLKMSFFVEGIEEEIWREYMNSVKTDTVAHENSMTNKMVRRGTIA